MSDTRTIDPIPTLLQAAVAAHQGGDLARAARGYADILGIDPENADALHLSGLIEFQIGRLDRAISLIGQAIARNGRVADYHANLGRVLQAAGRSAEAVETYRRALVLAPEAAPLHSDLAAALIAIEAHADAISACERAIALDATFAEAHVNLGLALFRSGRVAEAVPVFDRALDLQPGQAFALFHKGLALQETGENAEAENAYRRAVEADPGLIEARCNLGNLLKDRGEFSAAAAQYRAALAVDDAVAEVHANLGVALHELGDLDGALECFGRALDLDPESAEFHRNRAMVRLSLGRFAEGWEDYEWRWKTRHFAPIRRSFAVPQWNGEEIPRRRLLIHAEQGFGDTIQFMRCLPLAAARGAEIVFECQPELVELARQRIGTGRVIAAGNPVPPVDLHIPLLSLPRVLGIDLSTIPADVPYVFPDEDRLTAWQDRIPETGRLRVGIAWRGSAGFKRDAVRSPGFDAVKQVLQRLDIDVFALQKDGGGADLEGAGLAGRVPDVTGEWRDFSDTAAAVACLDLVIAPDTAIAHLAGALGKPVWILLPHVAEWRWLTGRADSPWYPTARLFRQERPGDWAGVVDRVGAELEELIRG